LCESVIINLHCAVEGTEKLIVDSAKRGIFDLFARERYDFLPSVLAQRGIILIVDSAKRGIFDLADIVVVLEQIFDLSANVLRGPFFSFAAINVC
jgi:hypothetical protein